ncbi:MAG TPA: DUF2239 family protein [Burkholderiaceae bacterium]|nr:DUF2239 family protein [Burkholderiaceae bacterium]
MSTPTPAPGPTHWIAFANHKRVAAGDPKAVATAVKQLVDAQPLTPVAIFDAVSSETIELDLRGSVAAVCRRLPVPAAAPPRPDAAAPADTPRGPGRPRLGVVAREVTLLPRHWDWLATQPGGASVALRKLVERARKENAEADRQRVAIDAAYRFMHALSGHEARFEEASRALFAGDMAQLRSAVARWPRDVRMHLLELVAQARPDALAQAPRAPTQAGPAR